MWFWRQKEAPQEEKVREVRTVEETIELKSDNSFSATITKKVIDGVPNQEATIYVHFDSGGYTSWKWNNIKSAKNIDKLIELLVRTKMELDIE